jgi:hypothetical protein
VGWGVEEGTKGQTTHDSRSVPIPIPIPTRAREREREREREEGRERMDGEDCSSGGGTQARHSSDELVGWLLVSA